jgi:hypothetical protein
MLSFNIGAVIYAQMDTDNLINNNSSYQYKSKITVSASKKKYKIYEPIHIIYEVINTSNKTDTFAQEFNSSFEYMSYEIKDLKTGILYNKRVYSLMGLYVKMPTLFLNSGDTLKLAMLLNTYYGEKIPLEPTQHSVFGLMQTYLPAGEYSLTARISLFNKPEFLTNTITFGVESIKENENIGFINDSVLIKIDSVFWEAAAFNEPQKVYVHFDKDNIPARENVLKLYETVLNKYPQSYYWMDIRIGYIMFMKLAFANSNIEEDIVYFTSKYPNSLFSKFLQQKTISQHYIKELRTLSQNLHK